MHPLLVQAVTALLLAAALLPVVALIHTPARRRLGQGLLVVWLIGLCAALAAWRPASLEEHQVTWRPVEMPVEGYVTSDTCDACHPWEHASWHASYHRTMTSAAEPELVRGNFDGRTVEAYGRTYRFLRRGDAFGVEVSGPGEDPVVRPVVMTTGYHREQVFWTASGHTRVLDLIPFVHDVREDRWLPFNSAFLRPPSPEPPGSLGRWNGVCIRCHVTDARPRLAGPRQMDTQFSEFGIACEACHGPGREHIEANRDPARRLRFHLGDEPDPTIVNPVRLEADKASQVCGQCHAVTSSYKRAGDLARWLEKGFVYRPGDDLFESRWLIGYNESLQEPIVERLLEREPHYLEERFWSDGMIRVAGREYNGLVDSPCFRGGEFSCFTCHTLHSRPDDPRELEEWAAGMLLEGASGDGACLSCHPDFEDRERRRAHTHHEAGSEGDACMNCHMGYTTYGLLKAIRSHQVASPSVQESLETGRPNACNQCHLDKPLGWTAHHLERLYGIPAPDLDEEARSVASGVVWILKGDAGQRALMAWSYAWPPAREASGDDWMEPYLGQLLRDPYDAVRNIAARSLREFPAGGVLTYDPLAPPPHWDAGWKRVRRHWRSRQDQRVGAERGAVLLHSDGDLRWEVFQALLSQRDDRRVNLVE